MSHYRAPPTVLPSSRQLAASLEDIGTDAWSDDVGELMAIIRASTAPCPTFAVDPTATLPPVSQVFQYVPPPVKTRSGQSWRVVIE